MHYRTKGSGFPLILLHQSPRSSREYTDLIEQWCPYFRVIAPDTPGNGLSDPLPDPQATVHNYADALIEFLDALRIKEAFLYGFHTGASIAVSTAARYPDRIKHAVANGLAILDDIQRQDFVANYLPELGLAEDGSHLTWLWRRIQKQAEFFPWYSTNPEHQLAIPAYSMEKCHDIFFDFMLSGNNYQLPYRAAFEFDPLSAGLLPASNVTVCAATPDPLHPSLGKLPKAQASFSEKLAKDCEHRALQILQALAGL